MTTLKFPLFVATIIVMLLGMPSLSGGKLATDKPNTPTVVSVLIVPVLVHSKNGIAKPKAISVLNKEIIARVEAMFPNYHTRPESDLAAGWLAGHQVFFVFQSGDVVRVTVSENENAGIWTTGRGDFETQGDFLALVRELRK